MSIKVLYSRGGQSEIECAFCAGKGIDPFELLSPISICPVCSGRKVVEIKEPILECAFCGGTGAHPHTRLTCTGCMGRGVQTIKEPVVTCPKCDGSGANIYGNMPCALCHGAGVIST